MLRSVSRALCNTAKLSGMAKRHSLFRSFAISQADAIKYYPQLFQQNYKMETFQEDFSDLIPKINAGLVNLKDDVPLTPTQLLSIVALESVISFQEYILRDKSLREARRAVIDKDMDKFEDLVELLMKSQESFSFEAVNRLCQQYKIKPEKLFTDLENEVNKSPEFQQELMRTINTFPMLKVTKPDSRKKLTEEQIKTILKEKLEMRKNFTYKIKNKQLELQITDSYINDKIAMKYQVEPTDMYLSAEEMTPAARQAYDEYAAGLKELAGQ